MDRLALDRLPCNDRAFVESMAGIHQRLETLKIVYAGDPAKLLVLITLQRSSASLTAAATGLSAGGENDQRDSHPEQDHGVKRE